jgi:hypothetical protein
MDRVESRRKSLQIYEEIRVLKEFQQYFSFGFPFFWQGGGKKTIKKIVS